MPGGTSEGSSSVSQVPKVVRGRGEKVSMDMVFCEARCCVPQRHGGTEVLFSVGARPREPMRDLRHAVPGVRTWRGRAIHAAVSSVGFSLRRKLQRAMRG